MKALFAAALLVISASAIAGWGNDYGPGRARGERELPGAFRCTLRQFMGDESYQEREISDYFRVGGQLRDVEPIPFTDSKGTKYGILVRGTIEGGQPIVELARIAGISPELKEIDQDAMVVVGGFETSIELAGRAGAPFDKFATKLTCRALFRD